MTDRDAAGVRFYRVGVRGDLVLRADGKSERFARRMALNIIAHSLDSEFEVERVSRVRALEQKTTRAEVKERARERAALVAGAVPARAPEDSAPELVACCEEHGPCPMRRKVQFVPRVLPLEACGVRRPGLRDGGFPRRRAITERSPDAQSPFLSLVRRPLASHGRGVGEAGGRRRRGVEERRAGRGRVVSAEQLYSVRMMRNGVTFDVPAWAGSKRGAGAAARRLVARLLGSETKNKPRAYLRADILCVSVVVEVEGFDREIEAE